MAGAGRFGPYFKIDIPQLLLEAQNRWLRPAEICEILRNYEKFCISPEPPHIPPSGSLFIFDRKVLRYFRKDGHNWRKKKDGKTVKEAHERLKAGSIDVLHCYYAHGEENENFQRRSYWMLEEELSHIVLVHYREVKGNRTKFIHNTDTEGAFSVSQEIEEKLPNSEVDSSATSRFQPNTFQSLSQNTDMTNSSGAHASEYEDVDSVYDFHSLEKLQLPVLVKTDPASPVPYLAVLDSISDPYEKKYIGTSLMESVSFDKENGKETAHATLSFEHQKQFDLPSWENTLENYTGGIQPVPFHSSITPIQSGTIVMTAKPEKVMEGFEKKQEFSSYAKVPSDSVFSNLSASLMSQKFLSDSNDLKAICDTKEVSFENLCSCLQPCEDGSDLGSSLTLDGKSNNPFAAKRLLDHSRGLAEALNKNDSFNRWMSKELGDVDDSHVPSNSGAYWDTVDSESGVDDRIPSQIHFESYTLPPSLSHDQLFCIIDFSPNWAYAGCETKILITGKFLKNQDTIKNCNWSCMFGEVEVPAEVLTHGVLRSHTPLHTPGRVPFYVTCSNRLACSEVREFDFRVDHCDEMDVADVENASIVLQMRLAKMLTLNSSPCSSTGEMSHISNKISSLLKVDDHNGWLEKLKLVSNENFPINDVQEQLLENILKENLEIWLLQKVDEGGKGPSVLDEKGQGVLHFSAALGYDWAILPTLVAGVSINFRDVNGWTALHWAASCGRERTVASLISMGAGPGLLTDPTLKYPSGRTPADLASANGYKGISGYLAESAISVHLSSLKLTESAEAFCAPPVKTAEAACEEGSMKASLTAVCNATQAAARIHQSFRVESFRRKQQMIEYSDTEYGLSEVPLLALKTRKSRFGEETAAAAAIRIQNKFRSWKGRKDFLIARQRIVRIQAHFRGHQVRKNYKKIVWSVGIVEKVILRWRRKGCGLRGFKPEVAAAAGEGPKRELCSSKEDDYDFLREGRKQTEERLQKALARVKSMAQYPEGRDQYRRLLTIVTHIQETKNESSEGGDVLMDVEALLDDVGDV